MILCGVDGSDEAAKAARFAAEVSVRVGARLTLVHAAPEPWVATLALDHERMQEQRAFDRAGYLETVVNPVRVNPAADVERLVEFGPAAEVLRSVAEELSATHLVVGLRGQGAVLEVLAASTSSALAREAPCPVILVPSGPASWSEDSAAPIVCGVDGSDGSLAAARRAAELAQRLDARLVLATVTEDADYEVPDAVVEELGAAVPGIRTDFERPSGQPADELLMLARRMEACLIVVGSRGRGAVTAAVLGSVSARLVQAEERPVMVVSRGSVTDS